MTNREWLIWRLIDMPDEEFADAIGGVCGTGTTLWSCRDCKRHGVNKNESSDCEDKLREWLKQEHEFNSSNSIKRVKVRAKLKRQNEGVSND